ITPGITLVPKEAYCADIVSNKGHACSQSPEYKMKSTDKATNSNTYIERNIQHAPLLTKKCDLLCIY
uniref:Uncharacterized protein n=1 Tax=Stegastes partitus TaxID=144197 RepID=A0A3B4ZC45_9TELE